MTAAQPIGNGDEVTGEPDRTPSGDHGPAPVGRPELVTVSVVSHGHGSLLLGLLSDLDRSVATPIEVIVTFNVPEGEEPGLDVFNFPVRIRRNSSARGFGSNHNAAFDEAAGQYFCVINPDIRLTDDPFPPLLAALEDEWTGVAGPAVLGPDDHLEDSARHFPTIGSLGSKLLHRVVLRHAAEPEYSIGEEIVTPDWIGGMCMVFRSTTFREVGGFDERFFLYYEDVDLCWRLRKAGYATVLVPAARVIHDAQRASWRSTRHMRWHAASMARFLAAQARSNSAGE